MWYYNSMYSELYHHGILGMKWGKRNGPPYPLGNNEHSYSEEKAGWRRSLESKQKAKETQTVHNRTGLTEKQKKVIKIGAAVAATALVVAGGVYLYKSGALNSLIKTGKHIVDDGVLRTEVSRIPIDRIKIDTVTPETINIVSDSPGNFAKNAAERIKPIKEYCNYNSLAASLSNDFDCELKPNSEYVGNVSKLMSKILKNPDDRVFPYPAIKPSDFQSQDIIANKILRFAKNKVGAHGTIASNLTGQSKGHVINWRIAETNGKPVVVFYDVWAHKYGSGYVPIEDASRYFGPILDGNQGIVTRLDGLTINDFNIDEINKIFSKFVSR